MLPSVPCPACLAGDGDEDLEFVMYGTDATVHEFENLLGDTPLTPADLIPPNIKSPTFIKGYS